MKKYENRFFNSTVWNEFAFRDDDIIVASYAKAGTTLVQQMLAQMIFAGKEDVNLAQLSPWLDSVYPEASVKLKLFEAQNHRRFIKTHLPHDYLPYRPTAKYLYIMRDGRDIAWSLYRHQCAISENAQQAIKSDSEQSKKLRVIEAPTMSVVEYFSEWLEQDGYPFWPFWENVRSWWQHRDQSNLKLLHFNNLTGDMPGQIREIADFLDIPLSDSHQQQILEHCNFDYMKEHAHRYVPETVSIWKDGGRAFFNRGESGGWKETLPAELSEKYEAIAREKLGEDCAYWLLTGTG
ncbi:MAG: sulfotransferase domain-containing protein [Reinekea sp.]|jgi:aryl sulfotransferase